MDIIDEVIEQSWYKFNPRLTQVCIQVINELSKHKFPPNERGFNKCWLFMQLLHSIHIDKPMNLPFYWFKDGVVVDPETLMLITRGVIKLKWESDCKGCQIEKECPCMGNPNNDAYSSIEKRLRLLHKSPTPE